MVPEETGTGDRVKEDFMFEIKDCKDYEAAKKLIREYSQIKGAESCFVSLDKELSDLASFYDGGALLMGYEDDIPIATIAIKKINDTQCEIRRLYISPGYRSRGYARLMMNAILERSRKSGFREAVFSTKPDVMPVAYSLYKKMGFEETENKNGTVYMRMSL